MAMSDELKSFRNAMLVGYVSLLFGIGFAIDEGSENANEGREAIVDSTKAVAIQACNRDFRTIRTLRREIRKVFARTDKLVADSSITPAAGKLIKQDTEELLLSYKLPDCRNAEQITDEPEKTNGTPKPLYPDG